MITATALLIASMSLAVDELSAPAPEAPPGPTTSSATSGAEPLRRWSSFLPLLADEARKRGVEMPLPFGLSLVYYRLERDIEVTDVRIGRDGASTTSVTQVAQFSSKSSVNNVNAKVDVWLLPFLNLYAFVGWFHNDSVTRVGVNVPVPGGRPPVERRLDISTSIDGSVEGIGLTLAGGYPPFFLVVDANAFASDLGFTDKLRGSLLSVRSGWAGSVAELPLNAWLSGTYWNTDTTVKSQVSDPDLGTIVYEVDQGPRWAWTFGGGANLRVHPHFEVFTEAGVDFHGGWYFVLGPTARM